MPPPKKLLIGSFIFLIVFALTLLIFQQNRQKQLEQNLENQQAKTEKTWPQTSQGKIRTALEKNEISRVQAALFFIQSSLEPEKLPKKYLGADPPFPRTPLRQNVQWAINNWQELPANIKNELEPYILAPDNEKYYLNQNQHSSLNTNIIPVAQAAESWKILSFDMLFKNSQGVYTEMSGIGQIYYQPGEEQIAERIKNAAIKSWQKFQDLLGNTLNKQVKIYYTELGADYGDAVWKNTQTQPYCQIRINKNKATGKSLEPTVAHELFHCFQYNLGEAYWKIINQQIDWLEEATATWAENFVYPEINSEQQYLEYYFNNLNRGLVYRDNAYEYGSYLWFFFLSQHLGRDSHIKTVLEKAKNGQVKKAIKNSVSDFADVFAEFSTFNWNQPPAELYQDTPSFPQEIPTEKIIGYVGIGVPEQFDYQAPMGPGQAHYADYIFPGTADKIKNVKFTFKNKNDNFRRIAFVLIGDRWERFNWSEVEEVEFCRRQDEENVKQVIVISANSDLDNGYTDTYQVDPSGDCKVEKTGTMKIYEQASFTFKEFNVTLTLKETVEYDPEENAFVVTSRQATCQSTDQTSMPDTPFGNVNSNATGNGSLNEDYSQRGKKDVRFKLLPDGNGYITTELTANNPNWVTYSNDLNGNSYTETSSCRGHWEARYDLKPEEIKKDRIKGKRTMPTPNGQIIIEFDYPLPE